MPLAASSFAGLTHLGSGKVRELFAVDTAAGEPALLLVASDRISAFDVIMPTEIPDKGAVLTALSLWWFDQLADLVPEPPADREGRRVPAGAGAVRRPAARPVDALPAPRHVPGRVRRARLPHRQRLQGLPGDRHGLRPRAARRAGRRQPAARSRSTRPSTKAPIGEHDENITRDDVVDQLGEAQADELERLTLGDLPPRVRHRRRARDAAGRHQVRVRPRPRRHPAPRRRGAHPGLVALLAGRRLGRPGRRSRPTTSSTCATG